MADKKDEKEQKAWTNFIERAKFFSETLARGERNLIEEASERMKESMSVYKTLHQQRLSNMETVSQYKPKPSTKKNDKKEGK